MQKSTRDAVTFTSKVQTLTALLLLASVLVIADADPFCPSFDRVPKVCPPPIESLEPYHSVKVFTEDDLLTFNTPTGDPLNGPCRLADGSGGNPILKQRLTTFKKCRRVALANTKVTAFQWNQATKRCKFYLKRPVRVEANTGGATVLCIRKEYKKYNPLEKSIGGENARGYGSCQTSASPVQEISLDYLDECMFEAQRLKAKGVEYDELSGVCRLFDEKPTDLIANTAGSQNWCFARQAGGNCATSPPDTYDTDQLRNFFDDDIILEDGSDIRAKPVRHGCGSVSGAVCCDVTPVQFGFECICTDLLPNVPDDWAIDAQINAALSPKKYKKCFQRYLSYVDKLTAAPISEYKAARVNLRDNYLSDLTIACENLRDTLPPAAQSGMNINRCAKTLVWTIALRNLEDPMACYTAAIENQCSARDSLSSCNGGVGRRIWFRFRR